MSPEERPPWPLLDLAERRMLDAFEEHGVERAGFVVGFVAPFQVSAWLATGTDAEREALRQHPGLREEVGRVLDAVGLSESNAEFDGGVQVESQETVDRDFEGNWFYALR